MFNYLLIFVVFNSAMALFSVGPERAHVESGREDRIQTPYRRLARILFDENRRPVLPVPDNTAALHLLGQIILEDGRNALDLVMEGQTTTIQEIQAEANNPQDSQPVGYEDSDEESSPDSDDEIDDGSSDDDVFSE